MKHAHVAVFGGSFQSSRKLQLKKCQRVAIRDVIPVVSGFSPLLPCLAFDWSDRQLIYFTQCEQSDSVTAFRLVGMELRLGKLDLWNVRSAGRNRRNTVHISASVADITLPPSVLPPSGIALERALRQHEEYNKGRFYTRQDVDRIRVLYRKWYVRQC